MQAHINHSYVFAIGHDISASNPSLFFSSQVDPKTLNKKTYSDVYFFIYTNNLK